MIKWVRVEAGDYMSEDDRFNIYAAWNRLYGDHWELVDYNMPIYDSRRHWHGDSLKHCKFIAEKIVKGEL